MKKLILTILLVSIGNFAVAEDGPGNSGGNLGEKYGSILKVLGYLTSDLQYDYQQASPLERNKKKPLLYKISSLYEDYRFAGTFKTPLPSFGNCNESLDQIAKFDKITEQVILTKRDIHLNPAQYEELSAISKQASAGFIKERNKFLTCIEATLPTSEEQADQINEKIESLRRQLKQ